MADRTYKLNKIVRGNIPNGHEAEGGSVEADILTGEAWQRAMIDKVGEELREVFKNPYSRDEYKDAVEAILGLAVSYGHDREQVLGDVATKAAEMGTFNEGIFIRTATVPDESWLSSYYSNDPERFPEL